ncbi:glucuronate isomerase [Petrocella sp. FN5]|uniref:glucuronate isomerase n=1 Tax=Petrocella sp. FN5 TaxID=3032002 RepID=UPI0023DC974E|nr:glucuronate isomerase [Petrocella sp. FN5]MDF1616860.1 glucuronate isomerase [Petrocella sp. FN5]
MKKFMSENFMLDNEVAVELYHTYAVHQQIIDYHCHLSVREIYENKQPQNITQLWLYGDHYKWRLMRSNGISEFFITGNASDYEKFEAYAQALPYAIGNPLYHWTHLELQRYFSIDTWLSPKTTKKIWDSCNDKIEKGDYSPRKLLETSNIYALCTTEDLMDTLEYHKLLDQDESFTVKVLPAMRPDKLLNIESDDFSMYIKNMSEITDVEIRNYQDLKKAVLIRIEEFVQCGCIASDHGFEKMPYRRSTEEEANAIFVKAMNGQSISEEDSEKYKTMLMLFLAKEYHRLGWAMELHIGPIRSRNTRMVEMVGESSGFDSIGDHSMAIAVSSFLNDLEMTVQLPKTILFSINDKDNGVIATMLGNFQDDKYPSKIQFGSAWWFQDHRDGMEKQMRDLANAGLLGRFIGMLTDSRSFLSYPRHEYFRRIFCNLIGSWIENGEYPYDLEAIEMLVTGVCFKNAKEYFGI